MFTVPGPSRMLRPELPKRYAPSGTAGNTVRLNHWSTVGFSIVPLRQRSGRLAPPLV